MAKGILETCPDINLNIDTDEIVQTSVVTRGVHLADQDQVKEICTKGDNVLKVAMKVFALESKLIRSETKDTLSSFPFRNIMEKRSIFLDKLEEDSTEYNTSLVEMKTRVSEVQDDMREDYLSQVENLDNMRNLHAVKYGKLKKSRGDVWDALKAATEEAWSELEFY